ncbi:MAG: acyltransferase domain-containing protein, partial [Giesbergeria sp.]
MNAMGFCRWSDETSDAPAYLLGHSLGEYNALLAAGAFDFATGLRLVKRRGELMAAARNGGMAAVIGIDELRLADLLRDNGLDTIDMANFNTLNQIVIAGTQQEIQRAQQVLAAREIRCAILNVSGAFHSRHMRQAQQAFDESVRTHAFGNLRIPVIANVSARPYREGEVADTLARQIASSVRWCDSIRYLMGAGCKEFIEIGSTVLTRMVDEIRRTATPLPLDTAGDRPLATPSVAPTPALAPVPVSGAPSEAGRRVPAAGLPTVPATPSAGVAAPSGPLTPETLGSALLRQRYGIRYAYMSGAMYRGIASPALVVRLGKAGMLGYFGIGGLSPAEIERGIAHIQGELRDGQSYGLNLLANYAYPELEREVVQIYLRHKVRFIEAAAFMSVTPALVLFRLQGLERCADGKIGNGRRIMAKVSRPEVAQAFMSPAPEHIVQQLLA